MKRKLQSLIAVALGVASVICVVTAVRIERLNHLSGGAIQRKARQEPNSKWRIEEGFIKTYQQVEADWRKESGVSPDAELSENDREAIWGRMKATKRIPSPRDKLGMVLGSWGLVQYPLAATLLFASLLASTNRKMTDAIPKWVFHFQTLIGALALGLALYRGYFTCLGW